MGRTIRDDYIEECIEKYKYIIRIVMRRFRIPYWRREDYYQLGLITLWNCIERYDPERFAPVEDENGDENDPFIGYIYNAIKYTYYAQLQKDRKVADNEMCYPNRMPKPMPATSWELKLCIDNSSFDSSYQ